MMQSEAQAAAEAAGGPLMMSEPRTGDREDGVWGSSPGTEELDTFFGMPSFDHKPAKVQYLKGLKGGAQLAQPQGSWFDVRVVYVRISACPVDGGSTPETLVFRCPPRDISCALEVNGARIAPSEEVSLTIRRDRVDCDSAEVTYVSTDRLRTSASVGFEVLHQEDQLLCGTLHKHEHRLVEVGGDVAAMQTQGMRPAWSLEGQCTVGGTGCIFLRSKHDYTTPLIPPSMEVCIVGKYSSVPIILTQTVLLTARRRNCRKVSLDAIPEVDEGDRVGTRLARLHLADDDESDASVADRSDGSNGRVNGKPDNYEGSFYDLPATDLGGYGLGAYGDGEEPEMSWFNAGVRVGVGLGLGMCLGLGIGVGIIMRSYQTATRTFRRNLF